MNNIYIALTKRGNAVETRMEEGIPLTVHRNHCTMFVVVNDGSKGALEITEACDRVDKPGVGIYRGAQSGAIGHPLITISKLTAHRFFPCHHHLPALSPIITASSLWPEQDNQPKNRLVGRLKGRTLNSQLQFSHRNLLALLALRSPPLMWRWQRSHLPLPPLLPV